jgi:hypothetical protein
VRIRASDLEQILHPGSAAAKGAKARRGGAAFEAELNRQHEQYALTNTARIFFVHSPTAPAGVKARPHLRVLVGKSEPDYRGWMIPGGRAVVMEAKSNAEPAASLSVSRDGRGLSWDQAGHLLAAVDDGVLASLVWRNGPSTLVLAGRALSTALAGGGTPSRPEYPTRLPAALFRPCSGAEWLSVASYF